jgi:hypothetical protein
MKLFSIHSLRLLALATLASLALGSAACSSDDDSNSTGGACAQAKKVADDCNAKQNPDSGSTTTITFDQAKCESAGSQGQTAANCIVANKSNCDCFIACGIKGTCP